jgi:chromosome segregation ATPase
VDTLTAEVAKRRADRATKTSGSPEYVAADALVQGIKPDLAKAEAALAAASGTPVPAAAPSAAPKLSPTEEEVAKAKAAVDAANAQIAAAKANVERWTRAQSFMVVHRAHESFTEKKTRHEDLVATAASALQPFEQTRAQISNLEKSTAEAPEKIKQSEVALVQATQARDAATKALADAQAAVAAKEMATNEQKKVEAEIAELTKKVEAQTAEIAKRRADRATKAAGSPEYAAADALVQAFKPEMAQTEAALAAAKAKPLPNADTAKAELLAAMVAVKQAEADAKLATGKVPVADQAVAKAKAQAAEAASQLAELKKKAPEIEKAGQAAKAKAEQDAAALVKEIEKAKAEAERIRAEYDAKWPPAQKSAAVAAASTKGS